MQISASVCFRCSDYQGQLTTPSHSGMMKPQSQVSAVQVTWSSEWSGRRCALKSWPESSSGTHPALTKSLIRPSRALQLASTSIPLTTWCSAPKNLANSALHCPIVLAIAPLLFRRSPENTRAMSERFISHLLCVLAREGGGWVRRSLECISCGEPVACVAPTRGLKLLGVSRRSLHGNPHQNPFWCGWTVWRRLPANVGAPG